MVPIKFIIDVKTKTSCVGSHESSTTACEPSKAGYRLRKKLKVNLDAKPGNQITMLLKNKDAQIVVITF